MTTLREPGGHPAATRRHPELPGSAHRVNDVVGDRL